MANLSKFEARGNNRKFKFNFVKDKVVESNCVYVTEEKFEEMYLENKRIKPFWDKETRKFVKVKNKITSIKLGINDNFRLDNGFVDRKILTTRSTLDFDELDEVVDYPFSLNYDNFFTMTNRIDVFSNISKIQARESVIDSLKGMSSNSLGNSNNAFGEMIKIKDYFKKSEAKTRHYEDNIIETFLTVSEDKVIVDKIIRSVNPINRSMTNRTIVKKKNVISSDVRYFSNKEVNTLPFYDRTQSKNDATLTGKQSLYVFTGEDLNNKILSNRNINKAIDESIIYASRGKSYDLSFSNGQGSILFAETLD